MDIKEIPYDYDLIIYYYNALKANKRPSYEANKILGMKQYIENNDIKDGVLLYMINYIVDKLNL